MQHKQPVSQFRKTLPAIAAALGMSVFIGLAIVAFGLNALFNQNVSPVQAAAETGTNIAAIQTTNQDLQTTISQFQAREAQYQSELQQAADQINQLNQQNLQYQQLVQALQNAGVIQITSNGQVLVSRGTGFPSEFREHDD